MILFETVHLLGILQWLDAVNYSSLDRKKHPVQSVKYNGT